jgi:hypothetical protein
VLQALRRFSVFDQSGDLVSGTEIVLVDDAGLAIDAGAFDDVVVELVAFFLGDEGVQYRVIQVDTDCGTSQWGREHITIQMFYLG